MKLLLQIEFTDGEYTVQLLSPDRIPLCQVDGLSRDNSITYGKQMIDYAFDVIGA